MSTKINILNASEKFNHVLEVLESCAADALSEIQNYLELPNLDLVISPCSDEYKTKSGIMGCVTTPYVIDIMLDADRKDLVEVINVELTDIIAHEIHHAVRASSGVECKTLLQNIVAEGLACHFETKFNGNKLPSLFDDIQNQDWMLLYEQMRPELNSAEFSYPVYFGGEDESKLPNHAAYWVGFNLVSQYINMHGGCAASLASIPAEQVVEKQA
ncbi:DUF2268 domain-containing putative Zn-dependent protease [Alkalimonas amylolytica]|uniref:Predicted Zn-dependent protease n=1 Tax=Alkalimonas amylolytica TaxID=152573 RepID=A0A1H4G1V0_ALKAM|nr:DUF2268 domain-containing putative Zn-dependent protease [Alkalimonas amylolytica]SEB03377.1 Predicted Zn-dependent protease [Alkalimonas amylolytica]